MTDDRTTRRGYLAAAGLATAGLAGLSGCTGGRKVSLEPQLPQERLNGAGWELTADPEERIEREVAIAGTTQAVTAHVKGDVYENVALKGRLREKASSLGATAGDSGEGEGAAEAVPTAVFVAAKAETDPPVGQLLSFSDAALKRLMNRAESQATSQLRKQGFENVRRVGSGTLEIEAAGEARHRRYRAERPYPSREFTRGGTAVTVEAGRFTVEAQLAVWPYGGLLAAGGGAYPGAEESLTVAVEGQPQEVPLGLEPAAYREQVREFTTLIS